MNCKKQLRDIKNLDFEKEYFSPAKLTKYNN